MKSKTPFKTSIAIIGGGHAGLITSILLAQDGIDVVCIDSENPKDFNTAIDQRTTAISYGSSQIIKKTGIWDSLVKKACPIKDIHILDGSHSELLLDFLSEDTSQEAFGWIVENHYLRQALYKAARSTKKLKHMTATKVVSMNRTDEGIIITCDNNAIVQADLVIGADGRQSFTRQWAGISSRQWSYNQNAIVCLVEHDNDHNNVAIEHFFSEGPFAILPMAPHKKGKYRSSIVWTEENNTKKSLLAYDDNIFNHALNARFPSSYGKVQCLSKRYSFPLNFSHAHHYIEDRIALIADAAHGIHPIAGQGLNLGLRDVDCLTTLLIKAKKNNKPLYDPKILKKYQSMRRADNMTMSATTDTLNHLFSNNKKAIKTVRSIGLRAVSKIGPAKKFFMKQAMGEK